MIDSYYRYGPGAAAARGALLGRAVVVTEALGNVPQVGIRIKPGPGGVHLLRRAVVRDRSQLCFARRGVAAILVL